MANPRKVVLDNSLNNARPESLGVLDKLVVDSKNVRKKVDLLRHNFIDISRDTYKRSLNTENILTLFPDLKIAGDIISASIVSPNGGIRSGIRYKLGGLNMTDEMSSSITNKIRSYINKTYNLDKNIYNIIFQALFAKGSYVECIIPEASLSTLINNISLDNLNNENFNPKDYLSNKHLGTTVSFNTESLINTISPNYIIRNDISMDRVNKTHQEYTINTEDLYLEFTDDIQILRKGRDTYKEKIKPNRLRVNNEDNTDEEDYHYLDMLFKDISEIPMEELQFVNGPDDNIRPSIGSPLIIKPKHESIIPVYVSNNPSEHIGYFLLIDENGNPLNIEKELGDYETECNTNINGSNTDFKNSIISRAYHNMFGMDNNVVLLKDVEQLYSDIVDQMIKQKLRNGDLDDIAEIRNKTDIYRVMLARSFKAKKTKLLYLPYENVQYYAFEHHDNGVGVSLLEKSATLLALASGLLMANINASMENAIPKTVVQVTLDEADQSPEETAEMIRGLILDSRRFDRPLNLFNIADISDWLVLTGHSIEIKHPEMPNIEFNRSSGEEARAEVNTDVYDNIMDKVYKNLGVTTEMIESGRNLEFASEIVTRNTLFALRIAKWQAIAMPLITEHVRKLIANDTILQNIIKMEVIENLDGLKALLRKSKYNKNKDIPDGKIISYFTDLVARNVTITLPLPDMQENNVLMEKLNSFTSMVNETIDNIYPDDAYPQELFKDMSEMITVIKNLLKAESIRKWCIENNFLTDILGWYQDDDNGQAKYPLLTNQVEGFSKISVRYMEEATRLISFLKTGIPAYTTLKEKLDGVGSDEYNNDDEDNNDNSEEDNNDDNTDSGSETEDKAPDVDMGDMPSSDDPEMKELGF